MSVFSDLAAQYGRLNPMPVSHSDLVARAQKEGGVCVALSVMYLAAYALERGADPFEDKFARMLNDRNNDLVIRQLQNAEDSRVETFRRALAASRSAGPAERLQILTDLWRGVGFANSVTSALDAFGCRRLTLYNPTNADPMIFSFQDNHPYSNVGQYVISQPGLHFIKLPTHALAAVCDDVQGDPFAYFFVDVNFGEFKSTSARNLKDFINDFMRRYASSNYEGDNDPCGVLTYRIG